MTPNPPSFPPWHRGKLSAKTDIDGMSLDQMNAMSESGQPKSGGIQGGKGGGINSTHSPGAPLFSALPVRLVPKVAPAGMCISMSCMCMSYICMPCMCMLCIYTYIHHI